jgi:hypothetical protein
MNLVIEDVVKSHSIKKMNSSLELAKMWLHITGTNPGGENPYHNNTHMKRMAGIAGFLLESDPFYATLTPDQKRIESTLLLIACLWHDYGHSAGKKPDLENIQFATEAFMNWFNGAWPEMIMYLEGKDHATLNKDDEEGAVKLAAKYAKVISELLKVTEFPFVHQPRTVLEKCIRDADLLYTFDVNTGQIVHGLYLELKSSGKFPFSFMSFMHRQSEFLDSCEHFTDLGKQIHATMKDDVLARQFAWAESQGFA